MAFSDVRLPGYDFRQWDIRMNIANKILPSELDYVIIVRDAIEFLGAKEVNKEFTENSKSYKYVCIKYQFRPPIDSLNTILKNIDLYSHA